MATSPNKKNVQGRRRSQMVKSRDLVIGMLVQHVTTGQVFRILDIDPDLKFITYRAETAFTGRGCAMALPLGETRTISNVSQWTGRLVRYKGAAS